MELFLVILLVLCLAGSGTLIFVFSRKTIKTFTSSAPFQDLENALVETVAERGWKLLSMHDLQAKLVNAGYDFKRIAVFEICKPDYAAAVLELDRNKKFSALMPCRISMYETAEGGTGISMINSGLMARLFGGVVNRVMGRASDESEEIIQTTINKAQSNEQ